MSEFKIEKVKKAAAAALRVADFLGADYVDNLLLKKES